MSRNSYDPTTGDLTLIAGSGGGGSADNFVGSLADWDALTTAEKAQYKTVDLIDDYVGVPTDATPTADSPNPVQSGGVKTYVDTGLALKADKTQISNPNLLDNPWFTVNQRDKNVYSETTQTFYTLDRWLCNTTLNQNDMTVTINDDNSITVQNSNASSRRAITQRIDKGYVRPNTPYTCSILTPDGIHHGTFTTPSVIPNDDTYINVFNFGLNDKYTLRIRYGDTYDSLSILLGANKTVTLIAVKLELGSESTLAMDTAPNYATELAKCQRYFIRLKPVGADTYYMLGTGLKSVVTSTNKYYLFVVPLPVTMRQKPSISYNLDSRVKVTSLSVIAVNGEVVTQISVDNLGPGTVTLKAYSDENLSYAAGTAVSLWIANSATAYIDLSADL